MNRSLSGVLLAAALAATVLGFAALYHLRLSQGDDYPEYSSLRSDPLGTRVLYESLAALPNMRVERGFQPLAKFHAAGPATMILAGMDSQEFAAMPIEVFNALDTAVRGGSRLVVAMRSDFTPEARGYGNEEPLPAASKDKAADKKKAADEKAGGKPATRLPPRMLGAEGSPKAPRIADLRRLWGIAFATHKMELFDKGAVPAAGAPGMLSRSLPWNSGIYFETEMGSRWRTLYDDFGKPVIIEMPYGRGSVVLAGDSYFLSNEALLKNRATPLLAWVIGPNARVDFDESHLGVVEDLGMAALARRYGMVWSFATLLLLVVLFAWRRMAGFVPPPEEIPDVTLSCSHTAALEELLLRSVAPGDLIAACSTEWRRTAPPRAAARLDAVLAAHPGSTATETYNAAVRALKRQIDFSNQ